MMKFLKLLILSAAFVLIFSLGVSAEEDTFRASVEKLLSVMKQDQLLEQVFQQVKQMEIQQLQQMNITQEQIPLMEKYFDKMFEVMKAEMSWDKIKDDFIQIYMSVYSETEVQALVNFYESPVGQKMLAKMPLLMQQSMAISQKHMKNIMPKIQEITLEMTNEIENQ